MSTFVDPTSGLVEYCQTMAGTFPDMAEPYYDKMVSYCQAKLWHQLTLLVLEFFAAKNTLRVVAAADGTTSSSNTFFGVYNHIVLKVAAKLNPLALARMAAEVSYLSLDPQVLPGGVVTESAMENSKKLLQDLLPKTEQPATLYLQSKLALLQMKDATTADAVAELPTIYSTIKSNATLLHQLMMPDTPEAIMVHSAHYQMSMTYFKLMGPPEAFYEQAIRYLNYYQPDLTSPVAQQEQHQLAVDLCLAALVGEGVYNLGQVVTNPILKCLANTPEHWLVDLLSACSMGSVAEFKACVNTKYPTQIASQPALVNMGTQMQEKMTLLALVQMVFERPSSERTLPFEDIGARLDIPIEQVEWVIMRAFSVKLMEGSMDQVEGIVHVTWILPRVLDATQLSDLATRFGEWGTNVSATKHYMQQQNPALTA
jgi:26S proteasome regulatory subunit N9